MSSETGSTRPGPATSEGAAAWTTTGFAPSPAWVSVTTNVIVRMNAAMPIRMAGFVFILCSKELIQTLCRLHRAPLRNIQEFNGNFAFGLLFCDEAVLDAN